MARIIVALAIATSGPLPLPAELVTCATTNSASLRDGVPRGGALATILCSGLSGKPGLLKAPDSGPLPFKLGDIEVLVNGALAPLTSIFIPSPEEADAGAKQRIEFQVPLERNATPDRDPIPVVRQAGSIIAGYGYFNPASYYELGPGGFFKDSAGFLTAEHTSNGTRVTPANPARRGETITVYANDFFSVWPPPPIGIPAPSEPSFEFSPDLSTASSDLGYDRGHLYLQRYPDVNSECRACTNTPALKILFQGLAPGKVGIERIDFVVPASQPAGDWALFFNIGSCPDGSGGLCSGKEARSSDYGLLSVR